MSRRVVYEWVVEWVDTHGDIAACSYWDEDELHKAKAAREPDHGCSKIDLGLCRHVFEVWDKSTPGGGDEVSRSYAYVTDGSLPSHFDDGAPVPKRFGKVQL